MSIIARRVIVEGRVTGVGFRYSTVRKARSCGSLQGHVRNVDARTVECVLQGEAHDVEAMVEWLRSGPPAAVVLRHMVTDIPVQAARTELYISH